MTMRRSANLEIPHVWRFDVTESAANTYTEQTVDTNLSAERGVIAQIDHVSVQIEEMPTANDELHVQGIINPGQTGILDLDSGNVLFLQHWATPNFAATNEARRQRMVEGYDFIVPVPYIAPTITIGIQGTSLAAAARVRARVVYRLKKVSQAQYLALLSSLTR